MDIKTIECLIKDIDQYEAHISENNKGEIIKREKLLEHIRLTEGYFSDVWKEKGMEEFLERFCGRICPELTPEGKKCLKEMIRGIPLFHDVGKINPKFQNEKMKNYCIKDQGEFFCVSSRHSLISSVLYIDYFFNEMKRTAVSKTDKKVLRQMIFCNAYIIARHHSDLQAFEKFLNELKDGIGQDIAEVFQQRKCTVYRGDFSLRGDMLRGRVKDMEKNIRTLSIEQGISLYVYSKILYSVLLASDYYATSEFESGMKVTQLGNLDKISEWIRIYEDTGLMKKIRIYQKNIYPGPENNLRQKTAIDQLRTEMLLDAESVLEEHSRETLFFLEAPTGSGKSNTAVDLSFQLMKADSRLKKIYYIYPFNTLVEQNMNSLQKIFENNPEILDNIAVINSLTPIKMSMEERDALDSELPFYYQKALLDRQFLNYPMIVSTHVSLFETLFGDTKESAFGFHQLMNSVVVLDEIQSYKNALWGEIILFLKELSYLLNMKILIMSATLPDLDLLSADTYPAVRLMTQKEKYFFNPCFRERVKISYELMKETNVEDALADHIAKSSLEGKKILIEFISKTTASAFFKRLQQDERISCDIEYMSGEDSLIERSRILEKIKKTNQAIILVATQVVEAGVDIDMDIGYKNISKLDSEEQFLGRINRSCRREGWVYFFKLDEPEAIYGRDKDIRVEKKFTLENPEMRELLVQKDFQEYYGRILDVLKQAHVNNVGDSGLISFFQNQVSRLDYNAVKRKMNLISEDTWSMSVYLARVLLDENGEEIDGRKIWKEYGELLRNLHMDYSEKKVKLSRLKSKMNYFIYQVKRKFNLDYSDKIGELFYIHDGEKYFDHGKLNRERIKSDIEEFIEFI